MRRLYARLDGTSRNIKNISVDEETLDAYGNFGMWLREKTAELIEMLYADEANAPAIVTLDFFFTGDSDEQKDNMLKMHVKERILSLQLPMWYTVALQSSRRKENCITTCGILIRERLIMQIMSEW